MDRNRNNVVLSRRVLLGESRKNEACGDPVPSCPRACASRARFPRSSDFGAFVDLGGIDGLVHISELSWNHVNHPSEVVKVGQEVEVEVLDVDLQRERISLGLKQTTPDRGSSWWRSTRSAPSSTARSPRSFRSARSSSWATPTSRAWCTSPRWLRKPHRHARRRSCKPVART
jgi:ribosomal protein S1